MSLDRASKIYLIRPAAYIWSIQKYRKTVPINGETKKSFLEYALNLNLEDTKIEMFEWFLQIIEKFYAL